MVQAVAIDQREVTELEVDNTFYVISNYVGDYRVIEDQPQGFLVELKTPRGVIQPHFHRIDQFQVVIDGGGRIGKHPLAPIAIHYADAFTPYGPIVTEEAGITFWNLRSASDIGAYWMPASRDKLERKARRSISRHVEATGPLSPGEADLSAVLPLEEDGLAAYSLRLAPGVRYTGPSPRDCAAQYYLVAAGSLIHDGRELPVRSLVHLTPNDDPATIVAGPAGLDAVIVQLPRRA